MSNRIEEARAFFREKYGTEAGPNRLETMARFADAAVKQREAEIADELEEISGSKHNDTYEWLVDVNAYIKKLREGTK